MFSSESNVEIKFKVKPIIREYFKLVCEYYDKSEEEAFEECVKVLFDRVLKQGESKGKVVITGDEDFLTSETIIGRIRKWFHNPDGHPYKMLKAFLMVSHDMNRSIDEPVDRFKMSNNFKELANCDESKFESIFRQMCSDSKRAYGNVFKYNRNTREVTLNRKFINVISSLDNSDN